MPCPYAERRGAIVYCRAAGKPVNPLAFPCLTNRYTKCKYYRQAQEQEQARAPKPQSEAAPRPAPQEAPAASPASAPQAATPATRGLTKEGTPARNCLECVFYVKTISYCTLLGVDVKDPNKPPCASQ